VSPRRRLPLVLLPALCVGCAGHHTATPTSGTLAELHGVKPDVAEVKVEGGLEQAMQGYRRFLEQTKETEMTPEAMRRLADLQLEKQFGIRNESATSKPMAAPAKAAVEAAQEKAAAPGARESDEDFETRTTAAEGVAWAPGAAADAEGPNEAIALYDKLLAEYPNYKDSDQILYQRARALDELGRTEEAIATMERLIRTNPSSPHFDEVQYRRGEYFFMRRRFKEAEGAYAAVIGLGARSSYYELSLYKLGWTLYKQDDYEEALHRYMALLDYKVSIGYDFDATHEEDDERRVADTFRVISLSFVNLAGGPSTVRDYFAHFGNRSYEDRIYANLGEHYLEKLRYDDAANTFKAFVALYPFHKAAPRFSMRVIETFTQGEFPKLVLEAKRDFAATYGLSGPYWNHFTPEDAPEVVGYLKSNLKDLASHYHAQYQGAVSADEKAESYREAQRWYGDFLGSFPKDAETPGINYRLADLLLENKDFGGAAKQYERTAYGYPMHPQSAAAGYAAVYAYREQLKVVGETVREPVVRDTIASSIRFADTFPDHEQAAAILGAAADDQYAMKDFAPAVVSAQRVIDTYPAAAAELRRSAWLVVAHGSFELADYPRAEKAYTAVLAGTPQDDAGRAALIDNLAASIYEQGSLAKTAGDFRAAADHFLRVRTAAPTSKIRANAEYDAGSALMALEDWSKAAGVLEGFRESYPDHPLVLEATRQIALAYRNAGVPARAATEYERLASKTEDPAVRADALLVAGDLFAESKSTEQALDAYTRYVEAFPQPVETALETRLKIAEIRQAAHDDTRYREELAGIVEVEAGAGAERTTRTKTIAARAALVLAEDVQRQFVAVKLVQPFETSLKNKKQSMDATIEALTRVLDYGIAEATSAATYDMAETYLDFSRSLVESERPADLADADKEEYEKAIAQEALPFREKGVELHRKNLELLQTGVLNASTEKSLARLVELIPERYARNEVSSGVVGGIDTYVYKTPLPDIYGPAL